MAIGRLSDWAHANGVVLFTAVGLGDLLRAHETFPFSARDVAALLTVGGREDVEARHSQALEQLALVTNVLRELSAEARQDHPEPIAARDIGRVTRRNGGAVTDDDVAVVLKFLAQTEIAAVRPESGVRIRCPPHRELQLSGFERSRAIESSASWSSGAFATIRNVVACVQARGPSHRHPELR